MLARIIDQIGKGLDREIRVHNEQERLPCQQTDRRKVLHRIEFHDILEELRIDHDCRIRRHQQRVSIRRDVRDIIRADIARAARPVFDNDGLLPFFG